MTCDCTHWKFTFSKPSMFHSLPLLFTLMSYAIQSKFKFPNIWLVDCWKFSCSTRCSTNNSCSHSAYFLSCSHVQILILIPLFLNIGCFGSSIGLDYGRFPTRVYLSSHLTSGCSIDLDHARTSLDSGIWPRSRRSSSTRWIWSLCESWHWCLLLCKLLTLGNASINQPTRSRTMRLDHCANCLH